VGGVRLVPLALAALLLGGACDTDEDRPATWSYIHAAVIAPSCATGNCHGALSRVAGVDLADRDGAYLVLVGRTCEGLVDGNGGGTPTPPPGNYVFPGHPERSPLLHLLRGDADRLMPPDMPLPGAEIDLVDRWIFEGATCE